MWRWVSMSDLFNASGCAGSTKQEAVLFAYLGRLVVPLLLGSLVRGEHAVVQKAFFNHKGCTIIKIKVFKSVSRVESTRYRLGD
jgi:hypothetical protein